MSINCNHFRCRHSYECKQEVYDFDRMLEMHYEELNAYFKLKALNLAEKDVDEGILFDEC